MVISADSKKAELLPIAKVYHPHYHEFSDDWLKWRLAYRGGKRFIDHYLEKYSDRELNEEFKRRKRYSYNPAFAKGAINDVKNSIYSRMGEITRNGGSKSYQRSVAGYEGGVDLTGSSMNTFLGQKVLPELLVMRKVGVFVDKGQLNGPTLIENINNRPYLYYYCTEDIRSWGFGPTNELVNILLVDHLDVFDDFSKLPNGIEDRLRWVYIGNDKRVHVKFYDMKGNPIDNDFNAVTNDWEIILDIDIIPFAISEISESLMNDIADYQIAMLNLASSNLNYALKSNFPFYVEQYDPRADNPYVRATNFENEEDECEPKGLVRPIPIIDKEGTQANARTAAPREVKVGTTHGRRYPVGTEAPAFIHPSPEPLQASLALGREMKAEMRQILNLTLSALEPKFASAQSKQMDQSGLEGGLSYIGLEMESLERKIARIWCEYDNTNEPTINYPKKYSLKTTDEISTEVKSLDEIRDRIPSRTGQKEVSKQLVDTLLSTKVSYETLQKIKSEIDKSDYMTSNAKDVQLDVQSGLVDLVTASNARGYDGEKVVPLAKEDHAQRAASIIEAQSSAAAARGVPDLSTNTSGGSREKQQVQDQTLNVDPSNPVRGPGANGT
jgi:hypothetical protein